MSVVADTIWIVVYIHCLKRPCLVFGLNDILYAFDQMSE